MRILVVSPSAPRFDATVHYWQAEFAACVSYLRGRFPSAAVIAEPAGLICAPARVIVRQLLEQPDFVLVWARVWESPAAREIGFLCREIVPHARVLVWGDGPLFMPQYFAREPFDAAVVGGDAELVLADAVARFVIGELPEHGVLAKAGETAWIGTRRGHRLRPVDWPFPAADVIPFSDYHLARELRGKPTDDLSFDVSRGCPVGCAWCVDPLKGGRKDRRRPVAATVDFMSANLGPYTQFQCHGPIFTADDVWTRHFVGELRRGQLEVPFKAVTLVNHLADQRLVADLASVGMRAMGFGIETLAANHRRLTPKVQERLLERVAANLHRQGVEGKAYTQVGLAGQCRDDVLYTHRLLLDLGFTVRPTGATPFHLLRSKAVAELDHLDLTRWDRKSFYDAGCGLSRREFFHLITSPATFKARQTAALDTILTTLVYIQRPIVDGGRMRLAFADNAGLTDDDMKAYTVDDAASSAIDWVRSALANASDLLVRAADELDTGTRTSDDFAVGQLLCDIEKRNAEAARLKSALRSAASEMTPTNVTVRTNAAILTEIRHRMEAIGRELYCTPDIEVADCDSENFIGIGEPHPHARVRGLPGKFGTGWPVFLPYLARAVQFHAEIPLPFAERFGPAAESGNLAGCRNLFKEQFADWSRNENKFSCHRCDSLLDVLSESRNRRCKMSGSSTSAPIDKNTLEIGVRVTGLPGTGFGSHRWSLPDAFARHGLGVEQMLRQALGKRIISGIFPVALWDRFPDPVREFLIEAARAVGEMHSPPYFPVVMGEEQLTRLFLQLPSDGPLCDIAAEDRASLHQLGIPDDGSISADQIGQVVNDFRQIADGDDFDKTFQLRSELDLYPLHKRVLGLLEYCLRLPGSGQYANRLRSAFEKEAHRSMASLRSTWSDSRRTSLEIGGGWIAFGSDRAKAVMTPGGLGCDLSELIDALVERVNRGFSGHANKLSCAVAKPRSLITAKRQAEQLAFLESSTWEARRSLQALANIIIDLRNFIEHGIDEVDGATLVVTNSEFWPMFSWMADNLPAWRDRDPPYHDGLPRDPTGTVTIPDAATRLVLSPQSLAQCLVLSALVLHAASSQLNISYR